MSSPAKQSKLSRYGFQVEGNTSEVSPEHESMLNEDGDTNFSDSGIHDQDTDEFESLESRSSNTTLFTDGGGSTCSSAESSAESSHELGKSV